MERNGMVRSDYTELYFFLKVILLVEKLLR